MFAGWCRWVSAEICGFEFDAAQYHSFSRPGLTDPIPGMGRVGMEHRGNNTLFV